MASDHYVRVLRVPLFVPGSLAERYLKVIKYVNVNLFIETKLRTYIFMYHVIEV